MVSHDAPVVLGTADYCCRVCAAFNRRYEFLPGRLLRGRLIATVRVDAQEPCKPVGALIVTGAYMIGLFFGLFICPTHGCGCFVARVRMFWLVYIRTIADVFPGLYIRTIADVFRLAVPERNDIDVSASPAATALALQPDKPHQAADRSRHILSPNPCHFGDRLHAGPSPTRSVSVQRDTGEYPPIARRHFPAPNGPF